MSWVEVSDTSSSYVEQSDKNTNYSVQLDDTQTWWEEQKLDGYANPGYYMYGYVVTTEIWDDEAKGTQVWQSL